MQTIAIEEAGGDLANAVARVRDRKERVRIGENGEACAALVPIEDLELLEKLKAAAPEREPAFFPGALVQRMARLGYWEWDEIADRCTGCSDGLGRLFGVTGEEYVRRTSSTQAYFEWVHPDDRARMRDVVAEARKNNAGYDAEYRVLRCDGTALDVREVAEPVLDDTGRMVRSTGIVQDITEHKRAERELKESETLLRSIYAQIPGAVYRRVQHPDGTVSYRFISSGVRRLLGFDAEELAADPHKLTDNIHAEDRDKRMEAMDRSASRLERYDEEYRFFLPSGETVWIRAIADPQRLENGDIVWTGLTLDVTDRKKLEEELRRSHDVLEEKIQARTAELKATNDALMREIDERREAETALRESEQRFRSLIDNVPVSILLKDLEGRYRLVNRLFCERYGVTPSAVIGRTDHGLHGADVAKAYAVQDREILDSGEVSVQKFTVPFVDGSRHIVEVTKFPVTGAMGETTGVGSISVDVTERDKAEMALRESEERLRLITDNLPAMIVYVDADQRYRFVNRKCSEWYARPADDIIGKRVADIYPDTYEKFAERFRQVEESGTIEFEDRIAYPDGMVRDIRATWLTHRAPDGTLEGFFSLVEDVTAFKQAEERARQSQKMEAVGQLTGGVAHDFNNLLAVIIGNAEILVEDLGDADPAPGAILRAARRGTELTQRLLAFSRRQPLDPRSTDLEELANGMAPILERTLGESIEISVSAGDCPWRAMADPGQVENALLNLAINARDAMPGGGKLSVECGCAKLDEADASRTPDATPGDYAVLSVGDTGTGMPASVLEHAFEPFFTTKEVGQGTGLGLSMIYGFARQSGGHVAIDSEEGRGTTVRLFLPRATAGGDAQAVDDPGDMPQGRGETVLVVEDDPDVRELAVKIVGGLGYRVIEAGEAKSAAAALANSDNVDLLLSDVILPGKLNGPDFARSATRDHPGLKVVFMSGYPTDATQSGARVDLGGPLLQKPLDRRKLAESLRAVLDG